MTRWLLSLPALLASVAAGAQNAPPMAVAVLGQPGLSWAECRAREERTMRDEGYSGLRDFGNGEFGFLAGQTASVACIRGQNETVVVIHVAGPGDVAAVRDRLLARMRTSASAPPPPATAPPSPGPATPGSSRFPNPTARDPSTGEVLPLSNCLDWGRGCGQQAADAFCHSRGFGDAVTFSDRTRPGRAWLPQAAPGRSICNDPGCGALTDVLCGFASGTTPTPAPMPAAPGSRPPPSTTIDYDRPRR